MIRNKNGQFVKQASPFEWCEFCGVHRVKKRRAKFCSELCQSRARIGKVGPRIGMSNSVAQNEKIRLAHLGKKTGPLSEEHKRKIGESHKGKIGYWSGRRFTVEHRKKISLSNRGKKSWRWSGGTNKYRKLEYGRIEYREWRKSVFERDHYTCQECGEQGYVEADHIKPWSLFPDLRYEISNGRTLCKKCHRIKTSKEMSENFKTWCANRLNK